jgi:hypothetical protein
MIRSSILGLALLATAGLPLSGHAAECEGRCVGPNGAVAVVSAGTCGADEECRAGCEASASGPARPYAVCVSRATGEVVVRKPLVQGDARRE